MHINYKLFRFEDMEIWKRAARLSMNVFSMADELEHHRLYRFAEQLRAAVLSITNNIAEGSGSISNSDFANFLNMARRSIFEVANILMILSRNGKGSHDQAQSILHELSEQSRMIMAFMRTLKT